jgi:quinol monooxygenase YgiN
MAKLAHHVFFTLHERHDEAIEHLLAECKKYLDNHPGLVDFSVGRRDRELARPVNQDFDVALHCVFQDRASHDAYQTAERHLQFIAANKPSWAEVRVYDSTLD